MFEKGGRLSHFGNMHLPANSCNWSGNINRPFRRYLPVTRTSITRAIRLDGSQSSFTKKIAPAISPIYGNNPGFQVYQYDRATATIQNYQTYYLTNLTEAGKSPVAVKGIWGLEYDFHEAYGISGLNPTTVAQLADRISADSTAARQYMKFYSVTRPQRLTRKRSTHTVVRS